MTATALLPSEPPHGPHEAAQVRAALHDLAGPRFRGRGPELARLRRFATEPPASAPAVLVVHGARGAGKSALAARFLLDQLATDDRAHALAYLDFALPGLDLRDGVSIVLELARQVLALRPDVAALAPTLERAARLFKEVGAAEHGGAAADRAARAATRRAATRELAADCGDALRAARIARVTLVIDISDELRRPSADRVLALGEQLGVLDACLPELRTIVASRMPLPLPGAAALALRALALEAVGAAPDAADGPAPAPAPGPDSAGPDPAGPDPAGPDPAPAGLLSPGELLELHQAILDTGAANDRFVADLLAPLPPGFVAALPAPGAACLRPLLERLNQRNRLGGGAQPLELVLSRLRASPHADLAALAGRLLARIAAVAGVGNAAGAPVGYAAELQESYTGPSDDTLPFPFLERGARVGHSVVKLAVTRHEGGAAAIGPDGEPRRFVGTGWLIARDLVITNFHVVCARETDEPDPSAADLALQIQATELQLDFDAPSGTPRTTKVLAGVATGARGGARDYALLRVEPLPEGWPDPLRLRRQPPAIPPQGYPVNIVQHPAGQPKRIAIRSNLLKAATPAELQYFGDTLGGASGSPLCNDAWEVIGLHRASGPSANVLVNGREAATYNVGIPIAAILADLQQAAPAVLAELAPQIA
jgi:endonuclease G